MQHVASIDTTFGATGYDVRVREAWEKLWARAFANWKGLQQLASVPDARWSGVKPRPLPGYYGSAYDAANAAVPVATFRGLV